MLILFSGLVISHERDPAGNIIPTKNAKHDRRDWMRTSENF